MESVSNGAHQGPVPRGKPKGEKNLKQTGRSRAPSGDRDLERKRAKAREYYHAHKDEALARKRQKYAQSKGKNVLVVQKGEADPPVPKRPGKVDALICINRSLLFLGREDKDGAELWARFAARILEGKE